MYKNTFAYTCTCIDTRSFQYEPKVLGKEYNVFAGYPFFQIQANLICLCVTLQRRCYSYPALPLPSSECFPPRGTSDYRQHSRMDWLGQSLQVGHYNQTVSDQRAAQKVNVGKIFIR